MTTANVNEIKDAKRPISKDERKILIASSLGTVFEWYDFFLYGSLAAVIAKQFFAKADPTTGLIFALLAFVTVSTHFVIIIPLAFLWSYLIIEKTHWPFSPQRTIGFSVLLIAMIAFKYLSTIGGPQSYDSDRLEGIKKLTFGDMFESFSTQVVRMFLIRCAQNYWLAPIILVSGIISLIADKKVFLAVWTLLACLGYIVIMGVSYAAAPFDFAPDAIGTAHGKAGGCADNRQRRAGGWGDNKFGTHCSALLNITFLSALVQTTQGCFLHRAEAGRQQEPAPHAKPNEACDAFRKAVGRSDAVRHFTSKKK